MSEAAQGVPPGYHTVTPYLIAPDADAVLAFIGEAFGGKTRERHTDDDGNVMHAEITIGDSVIMVGQANDEWPPRQAMIHLYVADVDQVYRKALDAGATPVREPEDMHYGDRSGGVDDPWGNQWWMATRLPT
jgi:PhnB protein